VDRKDERKGGRKTFMHGFTIVLFHKLRSLIYPGFLVLITSIAIILSNCLTNPQLGLGMH